MPKKLTAPVLDDQPDDIDDETFSELVVNKKRLNAVLQRRQSTRTAEIKASHSTVSHPKP